MRWTDVQDIAIELADTYPDEDPLTIGFVDLHKRVLALPGFDDDPQRSSEKILEAIQMTWIEEMD